MGSLQRIVLTLSVCGLLFSFANPSSALAKTNKRERRPLTRAEIRTAERRLVEMGYWTKDVTGPIEVGKRIGLIAFQKWEGRKVTGVMTRRDFDAIMSASPPQPKDRDYRHVEVDLDRQVLLLTNEQGDVTHVLPVSTGSGRHYNEKGMKGLAYTPRGRFRIYNKLPGWKRSPLGLLYYPNYFSDGLAIHGNPSVPRIPQSHGCIRVPMSTAQAVSNQVSIGTIVLIYDSESFVSAKDWADADKRKQPANIQ